MESGLAFIENGVADPTILFKKWLDDAKRSEQVLEPTVFCLSTSTRCGQVSARHVLLRRIDADGYVIVTDRRSKKSKEISENPSCAMAFLWTYFKDKSRIQRQVRIEGSIEELPVAEYEEIYNKEPLYCKIRAHICVQGTPVVWEQLKQQHDLLRAQAQQGVNKLAMPSHYVGYKIRPLMFDFYHAFDKHIADRISYCKSSDSIWQHFKISA